MSAAVHSAVSVLMRPRLHALLEVQPEDQHVKNTRIIFEVKGRLSQKGPFRPEGFCGRDTMDDEKPR